MDYTDTFHPNELNEYDINEEMEKRLDSIKKTDRGYNKIVKRVLHNNMMKKTKLEFFTTGATGSNIRDAQTGEYYPNIVGSLDEDLFFKVFLLTGECTSKNGSNVLFYLSPQQYMAHFNVEVSAERINEWTNKRELRLKCQRPEKREVPIVIMVK
jgi:hypothetical protein